MSKNIFTGFKKWYESLGVKSGLGLIAFALGLAGVGISADQLNYLYTSVPAAITGTLILFRRVTQYTSGLGFMGVLALVFGVLSGGVQALPPDIAGQWQQVHDLWVGILQIVLTVLGAYGIKRADKKVVLK